MELSVVLAVKNGEKYIAEQLRSVQNQTYKNFECIIIDDHSTDDTVNIVVRPTDDSLMESTYVVFDTETTGFNAGGEDSMIEIGAVKVDEQFNIVDEYQLKELGIKISDN